MPYLIGDKIKENAAHHESFKALWETKWKRPCSMGVYPFMFGKIDDFEPVVAKLIEMDMREPYDWEAYAKAFFPSAEKLVTRAQDAESSGDQKQASELYLRASALYRIARFPIPRSPAQKLSWEKNKEYAKKGLSLADIPMHEVLVPHTHRIAGEGKTIPIFMQVPPKASKESPAPCVVIFTGLDGYRTELALWKNVFLPKGCGLIVVEIPGTGDSPALKQDPQSPDREWSSLLDWIETQTSIDHKKLVVWGFSTGGYYAIRIAHTHRERLLGAVSLGGGCHHMFDPEWLDEVDHLEYPFDLAGGMAHKFGYPDTESMKKDAKARFSLLETGVLDTPCTKLLLVNGTDDEIFPIDDYMLALHHGDPKEARFVPKVKHMGEPLSFKVCLTWIFNIFEISVEGMKFPGPP